MTELIKHTAIDVPAGMTPKKDKPGELRKWQRKAYDKLRGKRHRIIMAPTGSGKSTLIKALGGTELLDDPSLKVVIVVPQTVIADGFRRPIKIKLGNFLLNWSVGHDLTDGSGANVAGLIAFVKGKPAADVAGRVMLCTHATLVRAHQKLMAERKGKRSPWGGVSLYVDETHHSQADDGPMVKANRIGDVVKHWLDANPGPLTLATATWLRGNLAAIVPLAKMGDFETYTYSMAEFLSDMQYIKHVVFRFLIGDPVEAVSVLYAEGRQKSILWIPHVRHTWVEANGGKLGALDVALSGVGPRTGTCSLGEVRRYQPKRGKPVDLVVVDLIDVNGRDERKKAFFKSRETAWEIIAALGIGKEGFDAPALARGICIGARDSMVDMLQMMGRPLRDYPGKETVEFNVVLPYDGDAEDAPELAAGYIKAILAAMVPEWQMQQAKGRAGAVAALLDDTETAVKIVNAVVDGALRDPGGHRSSKELITAAIDGAMRGSDVCVSPNDKAKLADAVQEMFTKTQKRMARKGNELPIDIDVTYGVLGCVRGLAFRFGYKSLVQLSESLGMRIGYVPIEDVRSRISGLTHQQYDDMRHSWGRGYPSSADFKRVYDMTFCEARDGKRGRGGHDIVYASVTEVRRRARGMNGRQYNAHRAVWSKELGVLFPNACEFRGPYGGTFLEVVHGRQRGTVASLDEVIALSGHMNDSEHNSHCKEWSRRLRKTVPYANEYKKHYGITRNQSRGRHVKGDPDRWVDIDELHTKIQYISQDEYSDRRASWGYNFPTFAHFKKIYGHTYGQIKRGEFREAKPAVRGGSSSKPSETHRGGRVERKAARRKRDRP